MKNSPIFINQLMPELNYLLGARIDFKIAF